jgi:hypothetical protein
MSRSYLYQGGLLVCGPDVCEGVSDYGVVEEILMWKSRLSVQNARDVAKVS